MRLSRRFAAISLLACGHPPTAFAQPVSPSWSLPTLMQTMAQVRSATGHFTERKTVQLLNAPLTTSGTLTYVAPDYMRKTIVSPAGQDFILDHQHITISGGPDHQTHTFSMTADPRIGGLVEAARSTLAGDLPTLQRFYAVSLSGDAASWQLLLRPKNPGVAQFVSWIVVRGSQNGIRVIDTQAGNGDHSEMGISEVVNGGK